VNIAGKLKRAGLDSYFFMLIGTVALAAILPARGAAADIVSTVGFFGVALLFFIYGAKLNPAAIMGGISNWRVQSLIASCTYVAFPVIGVTLAMLAGPWIEPEIRTGLIFVSILPSTVQSSIALTSLARGNVPAAVAAATLSNLAGVVLTPLFAAWLLRSDTGGFSFDTMKNIAIQILLPFALGQLARPRIGAWITAHKRLTLAIDRGAILLIVYSAFSAGVVAGIWSTVGITSLAMIVVVDAALLALLMLASTLGGRLLGINRADHFAVLFCGSTKSLATGVPIAHILFNDAGLGLIVLPLMLFHQMQLLTCAVIAQREAQTPEALARTA
jgi:sodium/bile acid cotransporter 7